MILPLSYRTKSLRSSMTLWWIMFSSVVLIGYNSDHCVIICHGFNLQKELRKLSVPIIGHRHHRTDATVSVLLLSSLKDTIRSSSSGESSDWNVNNDSNRRLLDDGTIMSTASSIRTAMPLKLPTICSSRQELFKMIRPNNIPGIVLFHMLGVYLVLVHATTTAAVVAGGSTGLVVVPNYWTILLKEPVLWLTLISTNLVSATSMVVNDYYDAKLGRDTLKQHQHQWLQQQQQGQLNDDSNSSSTDEIAANDSNDTKWILHPVNGIWNKLVTRRLLMYLYSMALCLSNCLPGIPTRISVNIALMMTYLYTVHFKPITLMKNIVCATLIALAPWTSGSCTLYLLQQQYHVNMIGAGGTSLSSLLHGGVWAIPSLWRLFGILFTGVLGREILMDCNDVVADRASGIRTIPVVYGCRIASYVATFTTGVMTYLAITAPLQQLLPLVSLPTASWNALVTARLWTTAPFRRLALAGLGCMIQLNGMRKILRTNGADKGVVDEMIQQNLYTVVLLMSSFV